jgi:hypothetical protein
MQFSNAGNKIAAAGNSTNRRAYAGSIANLPAGKIYVRIMLTDKDGKVSYSNVVALDNAAGAGIVRMYPNPAKSQVTISGLNQAKEIRVINGNGGVTSTTKVTGNQQVLHTDSWPAGLYNVRITQADGTIITLKLTKL